MRFVLGVVLVACAPSYEHEFARIDKRLESMETHVAKAEDNAHSASTAASTAASSAAVAVEEAHACNTKSTPPPSKPPPAWSCAANCIKSFNCTSNGTNNIKWKSLTATGTTAAEAFEKLGDQCSDEMYVDGKCVDGKFARTAATIVNACTKN